MEREGFTQTNERQKPFREDHLIRSEVVRPTAEKPPKAGSFLAAPVNGKSGAKDRRNKLSGRRGGLDAVRSGTISRGLWFLSGTVALTGILSLLMPDIAGYIIASGVGTIFGALVAISFVVWLTTVGIKNCTTIIDRIDRMFND